MSLRNAEGNRAQTQWGIRPQPWTVALLVLVTLKIVVLFILALNSRFVMDEFVQLGWAKYLGHGLFETVWHPKAVGYVLFYKLAHLLGWNANSILLIGRIQTALLACGTLAIIYACARAIGESRARALAIVLVMLCFSNIMERIFRTISEPLALFFAAAALLVVLRGKADQARTLLIAGVLSGLSFLATQKAVYFNVALGLALVVDAALQRRLLDGVRRGGWLVAGWLLPVVTYCFVFGGGNPIPVARNLVFGPMELVTTGADDYGGRLRKYVGKTLVQNAVLYLFCFTGMALALSRITKLDERRRITLIFSIVITALVFAHNQPWPYVFIMALPFMALWALLPVDRIPADTNFRPLAWVVLGIAVATSFIKNWTYLQYDNSAQLELVARAESLVGPNDVYFDGVAMLPNRSEPSTLWLDRIFVHRTLREGKNSEAWRIFSHSPPKVILWTYRMRDIYPVVAPLVRDSYVNVGPNIRMAGHQLQRSKPVLFNVPIVGTYALYSLSGEPLSGEILVDGIRQRQPVRLEIGPKTVTLESGPDAGLLLPVGSYRGKLSVGPDVETLFADVYR